MPKINTEQLKKLITTWLTEKRIQEHVRGWVGEHFTEDMDAAELREQLDIWELPKSYTAEQACERLVKLFSDGRHWKRTEKKHLAKYDTGTYFYKSHSGRYTFFQDFAGAHDQPLVDKLAAAGEATLQRCYLRVFHPDSQLADNFRLEVVTTPEDDVVVGWVVVVD